MINNNGTFDGAWNKGGGRHPDKAKIIALSQSIFSDQKAINDLAQWASREEETCNRVQKLRDGLSPECVKLVKDNWKLAKHFAAETSALNPYSLNDFSDYFLSALEVLCVCAVKYDPSKNASFTTYAYTSIKNRMLIENSYFAYAYRIPEKKMYLIGQIKHQSENMTEVRAAAKLGIRGFNSYQLISAMQHSKRLQDPIETDEGEMELEDVLADNNALTGREIEAQIDREYYLAKLSIALKKLPAFERTILSCRYGLNGKERKTLNELAKIYAQTIGGIRRAQMEAEEHLREIVVSLIEADNIKKQGEGKTFTRRFLITMLQPFTAPAVMPLTRDFWAMKIKSAVGIVESVMAAAMFPHSTAYDVMKKEVPTVAVIDFLKAKMPLKRYSFQLVMKPKIAVEPIPGSSTGISTCVRTCKVLAPSITAASSISFGRSCI